MLSDPPKLQIYSHLNVIINQYPARDFSSFSYSKSLLHSKIGSSYYYLLDLFAAPLDLEFKAPNQGDGAVPFLVERWWRMTFLKLLFATTVLIPWLSKRFSDVFTIRV